MSELKFDLSKPIEEILIELQDKVEDIIWCAGYNTICETGGFKACFGTDIKIAIAKKRRYQATWFWDWNGDIPHYFYELTVENRVIEQGPGGGLEQLYCAVLLSYEQNLLKKFKEREQKTINETEPAVTN